MSASIGAVDPHLPYKPHFAANIFFLAAFTTLFIIQVFKGCTHRIHSYSFGISMALYLECLGYAGKVMYSHNTSDTTMAGYLLYIICLSIGPNFISGVNYVSLSRLVWALGRQYSRLHPSIYSWGFIAADLVSTLVLGGGAAWASLLVPVEPGERMMIGGLAAQAFCSMLFAALCLDYYRRRRRMMRLDEYDKEEEEYLWSLGKKKIRAFGVAIAVSTTCMVIRACFRMAELSKGFYGPIARKEALFFAFDSVPVLVASAACTLITPHPDLWYASRIAQQGREVHSRHRSFEAQAQFLHKGSSL